MAYEIYKSMPINDSISTKSIFFFSCMLCAFSVYSKIKRIISMTKKIISKK